MTGEYDVIIVIKKVILISVMIISYFLSIIFVQTLPKEDKPLNWNLNSRFYLYAFDNIVDVILIIIAVNILPNEMKEPKMFTIIVIMGSFILSFVIRFLSDSHAVRERLEPYAKKHTDEYKKYLEQEKKFASWNIFEYAAFSSVLITIFLIIISDS